MNTLVLLLFGVVWFIFAYYWYGNVIKNKVLKSNDDTATPAHTKKDGIDFVPTKPQILFGHHFSSIAGAGPIVGPIIAYSFFGWVPALIWVLVGSVFLGAVHDYTSLVVSIRNGGISIVEVAEKTVSKNARTIFGIFVWLTLVLVQAVFADLTAKTLTEQPEIAMPTIGLIFLAAIFGTLVYKKNVNIVFPTIISLIIIGILTALGESIPILLPYDTWLIIIIFYSFVAAILPVWILLQPRDYLSMYILIAGLTLAFVGLIVSHPNITGPAFISFDSKIGPMFPMLFITIACGAISGFHSLVSSGTSAKQINKESDAKPVAFGSMLTEGLLALIVILIISSVLIWDPELTSGDKFSFQTLLKSSANLTFGNALGRIIEPLGIPLFLGTQFGVLMLNAFILTTLDTSARLNRYIVQETLGSRFGGIFMNKYFATGISLVVAYLLCLGNGYKALWPVFGTSNQLIGTLALFVISSYLFGVKAKKIYTLIPGYIMLVVTITALIYQAFWAYLPAGNWTLFVISIILLIMAIIISVEASKKLLIKT